MKKTILSITMLCVVLTASSFNEREKLPVSVISKSITATGTYSKLVMHDVNIVLTNDEASGIRVEGNEAAIRSTLVLNKNGELTVRGKSKFTGRNRVTVYVPASLLTSIQLNGHSSLSSTETLKNLNLDVLVNGFCKVELKSFGNINVDGGENCQFEVKRK